MSKAKNRLLIALSISLLITFWSVGFSVIAYVRLGSPLDRDPDGCVSRVLIEEGDRYILVCPDDTLPAKVALFLAPKAAVASILFLALVIYQSSKDKARNLKLER